MLQRDVPFFLRQLPQARKRLIVLELAAGTAARRSRSRRRGIASSASITRADMLAIASRKRDARRAYASASSSSSAATC